MESSDDPTPDPALDALLRSVAPAPDTRWAADLERRVLPQRAAAKRRWAGLPALAGAIGGLAVVVAVAGLAGGGPLAPQGGDEARAKPGCELVYVTRAESVGEIVRQADGSITVETTSKPVSRPQERCPGR